MIPEWNVLREQRDSEDRPRGRACFAFRFDDSFELSPLGEYELRPLAVYPDGAIDVGAYWVDRHLFANNLENRRDTSPAVDVPIGAVLHLFELGHAFVAEAEWRQSSAEIRSWVERTVSELNPQMQGLLDLGGEEFVPWSWGNRQAYWFAEKGWHSYAYRAADDGRVVVGDELPVFVREGDAYRVENWFIYADGSTQIGYAEPLLKFADVARLARQGEILSAVPDGTWVSIPGLGRFRTSGGRWSYGIGGKLRHGWEKVESLDILFGEFAVRRCRRALAEYKYYSSKGSRELLREAYEAVPESLRSVCGRIGTGDEPIRRILDDKA